MKYILPLLVVLTYAIGSLANIYINSDDWYVNLVKSPLDPPSFVFVIVWSILFTIMAFVAFKMAAKISSLFIAQLVANASWSWIFFYFHAPVIALIDISVLIFLNQKILKILKGESTVLFYLYLPYLIWLSFAAFLNASIVFLN